VTRTVQFVKKNPQRAHEVYSVYPGQARANTVVPEGVIDTRRIIIAVNLLMERLRCSGACMPLNDQKMDGVAAPYGMWVLPSFLRHSCVGTANRICYGDFMMVFAVSDLKKGEEVTIEYQPIAALPDRRERLQRSLGFECSCPMCTEELANPQLQKRSALTEELKELVHAGRSGRAQMQRMEKLIFDIEATYGNDRFRAGMAKLWVGLAHRWQGFDEKEKELEALLKGVHYYTNTSPGFLTERLEYLAVIAGLGWFTGRDNDVIAAREEMFETVRVLSTWSSGPRAVEQGQRGKHSE
jgi:hypothetical protein